MKGHWSHVNLAKREVLEMKGHWSHVNLVKHEVLEMKGHWSHVNLVKRKELLKDLNMTSVLSFSNAKAT